MSGKQGECSKIGVNGWDLAGGNEPLTLTRCHSYVKLKGGSQFGANPTT